jgi:hypothetical protein
MDLSSGDESEWSAKEDLFDSSSESDNGDELDDGDLEITGLKKPSNGHDGQVLRRRTGKQRKSTMRKKGVFTVHPL